MNEIVVPGRGRGVNELELLLHVVLPRFEVLDLLVDRLLLREEILGRLEPRDLLGRDRDRPDPLRAGAAQRAAARHSRPACRQCVGGVPGVGVTSFASPAASSGPKADCASVAPSIQQTYGQQRPADREQCGASTKNHAGPLFPDWVVSLGEFSSHSIAISPRGSTRMRGASVARAVPTSDARYRRVHALAAILLRRSRCPRRRCYRPRRRRENRPAESSARSSSG